MKGSAHVEFNIPGHIIAAAEGGLRQAEEIIATYASNVLRISGVTPGFVELGFSHDGSTLFLLPGNLTFSSCGEVWWLKGSQTNNTPPTPYKHLDDLLIDAIARLLQKEEKPFRTAKI